MTTKNAFRIALGVAAYMGLLSVAVAVFMLLLHLCDPEKFPLF